MTSESTSSDVLVDSALVCYEIFIDGEGGGDWSVGDQILLNGVDGSQSFFIEVK